MQRKNNQDMAVEVIRLNFPYVEMMLDREKNTIVFCGETTPDIIEKEYDRLYFMESFLNYLGYNLMMSEDPTHLKGSLTP